MNKEMDFIIFYLENYKVHKNLTGKQAYDLFEKYAYLIIYMNFMMYYILLVINMSMKILMSI